MLFEHRARRASLSTPAHAGVSGPHASLASIRHLAVCDDDLRFIRYVERALAPTAVRITPVTTFDLDEAVRVLAGAGCDAALVDLWMYNDRHAGFSLVERLRACPETSSLALFLATGDVREAHKNQAFLNAHGCALLAKPFGPDELMTTIGIGRRSFAA